MYVEIPFTTLAGKASELCQASGAEPFVQPWYEPIRTTPDNTGMAVGGLGNAFTLTPLGTVPALHNIAGLYVTGQKESTLPLQDVYVAVKEDIVPTKLYCPDVSALHQFAAYYPLQWQQQPLIDPQLTWQALLARLITACNSGQLWQENKAAITRWQRPLSPRTQQALAQEETAPATQTRLLLDFFGGLLTISSFTQQALSSAVDNAGALPPTPAAEVDYKALYPTAEYRYALAGSVIMRRKVVSPIVRHRPELCGLPLSWNQYEVTNNSAQPRTVTLVQYQPNITGSSAQKVRPGVQDAWCELLSFPHGQRQHCHWLKDQQAHGAAVIFSHDLAQQSDLNGELAIAALSEHATTNITLQSCCYRAGAAAAIQGALGSGCAHDLFVPGVFSDREPRAGLLAVDMELAPGETAQCTFVQVMDFPHIQCQYWHSQKRYTRDWPANEQRALNIIQHWFPQFGALEQAIAAEQQAFLETFTDQFSSIDAQQRFATMALNTLSFLAEGTVWDADNRCLIRECADYPFFNSLDVYFYGSFALLYLLPELDGHVMKHFAKAIISENRQPRRYWEYTTRPHADLPHPKFAGIRSPAGAVVHDLGSPFDIAPNAYTWHNVKEWKDLAPKFTLMVMRHYVMHHQLALINECWPAITASLDLLIEHQEPGAPLPLTHGTDDTFDNLSSYGISVYSGSLWIAALSAAVELAERVGDETHQRQYQTLLKQAQPAWQATLWDEQAGYFHFCATPITEDLLTGLQPHALKTELDIEGALSLTEWQQALNNYLNEAVSSSHTRYAERQRRKHHLLTDYPDVFTATAATQLLDTDSDASFAEPLLADTYLQWMGCPSLINETQRQRQLDKILATNFQAHSPSVGAANLVSTEGQPLTEFQAQDVWLGVQYSLALALKQAARPAQAEQLLMQVYEALYERAAIPFAAPEGFNTSVALDIDRLAHELGYTAADAQADFTWLSQHWLLDDGRITPALPTDLSTFMSQSQSTPNCPDIETLTALHHLLLRVSMKYTAGRYFRPGMIFSLYPSLKG